MKYWLEAFLAAFISTALYMFTWTIWSPVLFLIGLVTWTFAEYIGHRYVLHGLNTRLNRLHHRSPNYRIEEFSYAVWLLIGVTLPFPALTAGLLFGYFYYLVSHHSLHHAVEYVSPRLLLHHQGHHKNGRTNYGVSTIVWDIIFGTRNGKSKV